jgi:hypothetical protein
VVGSSNTGHPEFVILVNFLPREANSELQSNTEMLTSINACLRVHPTRNMSDVLPLHTRLHTSMCTTDTITDVRQILFLNCPFCILAATPRKKRKKTLSQHSCMKKLVANIILQHG